MGRFCPILALIATSSVDSWQLHQSFHTLQIPGGRELRVLVQKVSALGHLVAVQLRHELHVHAGLSICLAPRSRVGARCIEPLPCRECCAHWGPNEKHRLASLQELAGFDPLRRDCEIPGLAVVRVVHCEIQCQSWAEICRTRSHDFLGDSWGRLDF